MSKEIKQYVTTPISVAYDAELSPRACKIYLCLRGFYNEQRQDPVFPSRKTLAERSGLSVDTVDRAIKELEKRGYITRDKGRTGYSTRYQFTDRKRLITSRIVAASPDAWLRIGNRNFEEALAAESHPQPELKNHNQEPEIPDDSYRRNREQLDKIRSELPKILSFPKNTEFKEE